MCVQKGKVQWAAAAGGCEVQLADLRFDLKFKLISSLIKKFGGVGTG